MQRKHTLGRLLRGLHAGEQHLAWNHQSMQYASQCIMLKSADFEDGDEMPLRTAGIGVGENISPELHSVRRPEGRERARAHPRRSVRTLPASLRSSHLVGHRPEYGRTPRRGPFGRKRPTLRDRPREGDSRADRIRGAPRPARSWPSRLPFRAFRAGEEAGSFRAAVPVLAFKGSAGKGHCEG